MTDFDKIEPLLKKRFLNPDASLKHYQKALLERCPDSLEEELGPVFLQKKNDLPELFQKRIFCLGDSCVDMSKKFDWTTAANGDLEWTCALARHHHFPVLAREYARSGDESIAEEAISQITNWIDNVPRPQFHDSMEYLKIKRSNWRALETGFRIGETWPLALKHLITSSAMTSEIWSKILFSLHNQADYLSLYRWEYGNHSIMEAAMLATYCVIFKEFKGTEKWLEQCMRFLDDSFDKAFYEDGYSREMSGGYRWVMVKGYISLFEVLRKNQKTELLPKGLASKIKKAAKAELYHLKPDLSVPVTNESNSTALRKSQLQRFQNAFNDKEVEFVLSKGAKGRRPSCGSYYFKDARIAIMRSDWTEKALYLSFDMGEKGRHSIGDQLSVDISAYGRKFIANCGRWRYTTSPDDVDWMDWAEYFKSSAACNIVMPVNATQVLSDANGEMTIRNDCDHAKGVFKGGYMRGDQLLEISHEREVLFVKPFFWIIKDVLSAKEDMEEEFQQLWHFLETEKNVSALTAGAAAFTENEDANIIIKQIASGVDMRLFKGREKEPFRGWQCPDYASKAPAFELVASKKGRLPIVFETLLFPVPGKVEEVPEFSREDDKYIVKYSGAKWMIKQEKNQYKIKRS